jgi:hypothetical protein
MTEKELQLALWESRSLRCTAESQKYHAMACAMLAIGDLKRHKEFLRQSVLFGKAASKCVEKAVQYGMRRLSEEENRDRV